MRTQRVIVRNRCSASRIPCEFEPLVASLTLACWTILGDALVDLRLLGSVARGEARPGESDLDIVALVRTCPSEKVCGDLAAVAEESQSLYRVVRRIDLDVYEIDGLSDFQRLTLSSDSISLHGVDTLTRSRQSVDREWLAHTVTPDVGETTRAYEESLDDLDNTAEEQLTEYGRVIGRDLLRCLRGEALRRGSRYSPSMTEIDAQVGQFVPECRELAARLYATYRNPRKSKAELVSLLSEARDYLGVGERTERQISTRST
jgi:predicted nucleotidyltransferase